MAVLRFARFGIGEKVRHRSFGFGGTIEDVDPTYSGTEEWWDAIPDETRPKRDQPFYWVRIDYGADNDVAYVSEQNLTLDLERQRLSLTTEGRPQRDDFADFVLH